MGNSETRYYRTAAKPKPDTSPNIVRVDADQAELKGVIHLEEDLDFDIAENVRDHRTDRYECTESRKDEGFGSEAVLVVRRGQTFNITATFDRPFSLEKDDLIIEARTGERAEMYASTYGRFTIDETGDCKYKADEWGGKLLKKSGNTATIQIHIDCDCAIGKWRLNVITRSKVQGGEKMREFVAENEETFIVLFNPWCKDDAVYMDDDKLLNEFALNDLGCVWKGEQHAPRGKAWNFGQFEDGILEICLWLIQKVLTGKKQHKLSNPIDVSRAIAQLVNCCDREGGVLYGNWSGDYADGARPSSWNGSVKILQQYWKTRKPVRYGQCWVFSGVTLTVCRALGLPSLSITNYASAHDTDKNCIIEKLFKRNEEGGLDSIGSDSVWNFHVWNQVWMTRPDLCPKGTYNGWQVIDATPQERSEDGIFTCGPSSLKAIKEGHVAKMYDTAFAFAEVQADTIYLEDMGHGKWKKFKFRTDKVGKKLSTKKPDGKRFDSSAYWGMRDDFTEQYKYKDGSPEGRNAVMRAALRCKNVSEFYTGEAEEKEDVEFKLLHDAPKILGKDVEVKLTAQNVSEYRKTLSHVHFSFNRLNNKGELGKKIKAHQLKVDEDLKPGKVYEYKYTLPAKEYLEALDDDLGMGIQAFAEVEKTRSRPLQSCIKAHTCVFHEPDVEVVLPSKARVGEEFEACLKFENRLEDELTGCTAGYEGRGFPHVDDVKQDNVRGQGTGEARFKMVAKKKGTFNLVFHFSSKQLAYLSGTAEIDIE